MAIPGGSSATFSATNFSRLKRCRISGSFGASETPPLFEGVVLVCAWVSQQERKSHVCRGKSLFDSRLALCCGCVSLCLYLCLCLLLLSRGTTSAGSGTGLKPCLTSGLWP